MGKASKLQSLANLPLLGPEDSIAERDSRIIHDFFPSDFTHPTAPSTPLRDAIFTQLYNEVRWQRMLHQQGEVPRLVCCQGQFGEDGSMPVYRHPTDQTLPLLHFSPKVQVIRKQAEKLVGHPLNHVLIQMYRSGNDHISEHSDKTLDITKGSSIVNVSFGAQRTMRLRAKKASKPADEASPYSEEKTDTAERATQRVAMPHNSMFVLGLKSNERWLHGIMPDKRLPAERSEVETAYNGIRISLTFRNIATFLDTKESIIWGQGATAKVQRDAADIINGDEEEGERMIRAFSRENHSNEFNWEEHYGAGFDVLHLHRAPDDLPILFASNNAIETKQAQIALWEAKIKFTLMEAPALAEEFEVDRQVAFRDSDAQHTEVVMSLSILPYIDRYYPLDRDERSKSCTANAYTVILLAAGVLKAWYNYAAGVPGYLAELTSLLQTLEDKLVTDSGPFIAGPRFSIGDCYVWPIIDEIVAKWDRWDAEGFPALAEYYKTSWKKKASLKKCREKLSQRYERVVAESSTAAMDVEKEL
jgi:alkylated DNA repair dioxygenase AlkB